MIGRIEQGIKTSHEKQAALDANRDTKAAEVTRKTGGTLARLAG